MSRIAIAFLMGFLGFGFLGMGVDGLFYYPAGLPATDMKYVPTKQFTFDLSIAFFIVGLILIAGAVVYVLRRKSATPSEARGPITQ